jgi:NAD-dependent histone deacetylase SIR2
VLYNESNPDETAIGNVSMSDLRSRPDAVLVVGTSLKIPSVRRLVRELCKVTRDRRDGLAVWINLDAEPQGVEFKDCWDLVIRGKCDDVAELAQLPRWDEQEGVENAELSEEEEKVKELLLKRDTLEVQISPRLPEQTTPGKLDTILDKKFKAVEQVQGIPTPGASPQLSATKAPKIIIKKTTQSKLAFASKNANQSQPGPGHPRKKLPSEPVRKPLPMGQPPRTKLPTQPTRKAIPAKRPSSVLPPAKAKKQMKDRVKSHKVTEAFKTKKSTVSRATPPPKKLAAVNASPATPESDSSLSDIPSDSIMPELPEPELPALSGLPDLRPPKRSISESFRYTMESKVAATLDSSDSELSAPPSTPTRPIVESEGIVSPISVPRNMAHLID